MSLKLEKWGIIASGTPYTAPELIHPILVGYLVGTHSRLGTYTLEDKNSVFTSTLVNLDINTNTAQTKSGTIYSLGEVSTSFQKYLDEHGYTLYDYAKCLNLKE